MENKSFVGFYRENVEVKQDKEVFIKGFPEPFVIREVSSKEYSDMQEKCRVTEIIDGRQVTTLDIKELETMLVMASLVSPNLHNKELQDSWGVVTAKDLKNTMFNAGQGQNLQLAILRHSDLDEDFNKKVDEAKKN